MNKKIPSLSSLIFVCLMFPALAEEVVEIDDAMVPPGQLIDVGGYSLHIFCQGETGPAVIMDAGIGGFSLEWIPVQRLLYDKVKVCVYDRAGYGWSEPGPSPRTTEQVVEELHTLLQLASIPPPYILVGHSFGGYNMQYFAKRYPEEAAGLILVDSSHPDQADRLPELPAVRDRSKVSEVITFYQGQSTFKFYPEDMRPKLMWVLSQTKIYQTHKRESINFAISGVQVQQAGPLPDIPLIVITRGKRVWPDDPYGNMLEATWYEMQKELAGLAPSGQQIIAVESDHLIHLEQPEVVALSVWSVLETVRYPATTVQLND